MYGSKDTARGCLTTSCPLLKKKPERAESCWAGLVARFAEICFHNREAEMRGRRLHLSDVAIGTRQGPPIGIWRRRAGRQHGRRPPRVEATRDEPGAVSQGTAGRRRCHSSGARHRSPASVEGRSVVPPPRKEATSTGEASAPRHGAREQGARRQRAETMPRLRCTQSQTACTGRIRGTRGVFPPL